MSDLSKPGARVDVDGPSIRMSLVKSLIRFNGVKRMFGSAERTEAQITKKQRAGAAPRPGRFDRKFQIRSTTYAGLSTVSIEPRGSDFQTPSILYLPGNAHLYPAMKTHWSIVEALAEDNQTRVHMAPYPLAPGSSAKTVIPTIADLVEEMAAAEGRAPVLAGDSAGGGLALATAQHLRDQGRPLPAHLLLVSPWLDLSMPDPDPTAGRARDPILAAPGLLHAAGHWARDLPLTASQVSPIYGEMGGLCPITVVAGTADIVYPDSERLAVACRDAGADFSMLVAAGAFHVFVAAPGLPESKAARRHISSRIG
jgi:epsilon-lactone hydrolase